MTVAVFSFTMGVHLGKNVIGGTGVTEEHAAESLKSEEDALPNRQEFVERGKGVDQESDLALSQSLHGEVSKTGIRLEVNRPVDLPTAPKSPQAGATTTAREELKKISRITLEGRFTLQVASFPTQAEAAQAVDRLEKAGAMAFMKEAEVKNVGKRYRIFLGKFDSKEAAVVAGNEYKAKKLIDGYLVQNHHE